MNRRMWTGSLASVVASVGLAAGQTAPSTATDGASNSVVTLRTAGQPDRKLQVLKSEKMPDGKILTEVKDLTTGVVFTIADTKPFANVEPVAVTAPSPSRMTAALASAPLPTVAPAPQSQQSQATMLPGTQIPAASSSLPTARPRSADPLLAGHSVPTTANTAAVTKPRSNYENVTAPQTEYPTLMGKLRGNKETANTVPAQPTNVPPKQSAISAALFGTYPVQSQPTPTVMDKVTTTKSTVVTTQHSTAFPTSIPAPEKTGGGIKSALFGTPNTQPTETPTLMGKLFGDKPTVQPTTTMTTVTQAPAKSMNTNVIRPNSVASSNSRIMTPTPQVGNTQAMNTPPMNNMVAAAPAMEAKMNSVKQVSVNAPTITMPAMSTAPAVERASYAPVSTDTKDPNFHVVAGATSNMKQIEEQVKELRMNQRPSKRMDAATSLAAGPMANMVEVRQILAEASYRDPVGVVRAHCIDLLNKMKYDEYNYKQYVETLVNDEEPAVQRAARNAMK
ncbi:hypothetical protein BH11PLA2_BH11PLA2_05010 [soil metagenome]